MIEKKYTLIYLQLFSIMGYTHFVEVEYSVTARLSEGHPEHFTLLYIATGDFACLYIH